MLDDFSKSKREKVKIPTLMITKEDGKTITGKVEGVSVSIPQDLGINFAKISLMY